MGYWLLVIGYGLLGIGYWVLAIEYGRKSRISVPLHFTLIPRASTPYTPRFTSTPYTLHQKRQRPCL